MNPTNISQKSDLEIARDYAMKPVAAIAESLGINGDDLDLYGRYKAKLDLGLVNREAMSAGRLILVSALSPTPAGEGKTTTSIGLADGINSIGKKSVVVLREPSLGPVFGMKGGATGGGYAQVVPMEDINLHFTGDFAAVEKAHNLLAALVDNQLQSPKSGLGLDPRSVSLKRVMDMNDRALRQIVIGLGGPSSGVPRESGFDITAASEVMAILCLAQNYRDLQARLGGILVGQTFDKKPVFARDLDAQGAMAALLKDALRPNLVQTLAGNPAIIHGGPFANIAQGTNSVLATCLGLSLSDYVVTEAGFGFDLGAEKFFNIKCQSAGLSPRVVVLVATARALKYHGGVAREDLHRPDVVALERGLPNLIKHLENIQKFAVPAVVAINRFPADSEAEIAAITKACAACGVEACLNDSWAAGPAGARDLAQAVVKAADSFRGHFKPLYEPEDTVEEKIAKIVTNFYGGKAVAYTPQARKDLNLIKSLNYNHLPVCMAKTEKSFSDDPSLLGRPQDFVLTVRRIEIAAGAGFVVPITGAMMRMPGLPAKPAAAAIRVDEDGQISGLF